MFELSLRDILVVLEEAYNWLLRSVEKINDEQERNKRIAYPLGCIIRNDKTSPKLLIRIISPILTAISRP